MRKGPRVFKRNVPSSDTLHKKVGRGHLLQNLKNIIMRSVLIGHFCNQNEPPRLDAHIRKATETTNWYPSRGAKMDPQIWPGNSTKCRPRSLKNLARKLNKKWSKHHWPAPLASTIGTAGQQHCPLPLVSTAGRHHWPRPLATCSYTSMTMRPTSWKGTLGSTIGQHCWPALFKPMARSTTGQYHRPAAPVAITTGQHHWPTMLASKTG